MTTKATGSELSRMKGRRIAARMLCEMNRVSEYEASIAGMNPYSLYDEYRYKGVPQDNIVLRYLQRAASQGDECVAGFCSVLSDLCGIDSGMFNPDAYRLATKEAISAGDPPTREQVLREHELDELKANQTGISLH